MKEVAGEKPPARASDRVPAAMLQRSPFGSAVAAVLPARQVSAAQNQKPAATERVLAFRQAHPRRRNDGPAGLVGGSTNRGRDDTVSTSAPTTTITSAVGNVTTILPAPVKKLI